MRKFWKKIKALYYSRHHICQIFGASAVYFEVYCEMPFCLLIYHWLFHSIAPDGWTNWDFFHGPNYAKFSKAKDKDLFDVESKEEKYFREVRDNVVKGCGDEYKSYLGNTSITSKEAGLMYWKDIQDLKEQYIFTDLRLVIQLYIVSSVLYIITNGFLVLACSMEVHGNRKALIVAVVLDIFPHLTNGVAVILFQSAKFCLLDLIVFILPFRLIYMILFLIRLICAFGKMYLVITYIKILTDKENLKLVQFKARNSATYQLHAPETELGISHDIFSNEHYTATLHLGGETASEEKERLRQHKLLMDAVNASLNASTSSMDLRQLGQNLLDDNSKMALNTKDNNSISQRSSSMYGPDALPRINASVMSLTTMLADQSKVKWESDDDTSAPKTRKNRKIAPK